MAVREGAARRMPGTVLITVVLIGLLGVLAGVGTLAYGALRFDDGGGPLILVGLGVLVLAAALVYGLITRSRWAQITAGVIGVFGALAAITALTQGNPLNLVWGGLAALIGASATIPVSAREWFSR